MSEAPERIWAWPTERTPVPAKDRSKARWIRGKWKDHDSNAYGDVNYIRADIHEAVMATNRELVAQIAKMHSDYGPVIEQVNAQAAAIKREGE